MKLKIIRTPEKILPEEGITFGTYDHENDWMLIAMSDRKNNCMDTLNKQEIKSIIDRLTEQIK